MNDHHLPATDVVENWHCPISFVLEPYSGLGVDNMLSKQISGKEVNICSKLASYSTPEQFDQPPHFPQQFYRKWLPANGELPSFQRCCSVQAA